jgi:alkylated DNA repair dioxygenase AlkB
MANKKNRVHSYIHISESADFLKTRYEMETNKNKKKKLWALYLWAGKVALCYPDLERHINCRQSTIRNWFNLYELYGLEGLLESKNRYLDILRIDGKAMLYGIFFSSKESEQFFNCLLKRIEWRHDTIKHFGKEIPLPRLTAWYGDAGKVYTYSKIRMEPLDWTSELLKIKNRVEKISNCTFNSVLINQYRDGRDSVAWHSDDEKELGENPVIASVSFGATRQFMLKHKTRKDVEPITIDLTSGSLLLMKDKSQECWLHQIPKTTKPISARINLTFRTIID